MKFSPSIQKLVDAAHRALGNGRKRTAKKHTTKKRPIAKRGKKPARAHFPAKSKRAAPTLRGLDGKPLRWYPISGGRHVLYISNAHGSTVAKLFVERVAGGGYEWTAETEEGDAKDYGGASTKTSAKQQAVAAGAKHFRRYLGSKAGNAKRRTVANSSRKRKATKRTTARKRPAKRRRSATTTKSSRAPARRKTKWAHDSFRELRWQPAGGTNRWSVTVSNPRGDSVGVAVVEPWPERAGWFEWSVGRKHYIGPPLAHGISPNPRAAKELAYAALVKHFRRYLK